MTRVPGTAVKVGTHLKNGAIAVPVPYVVGNGNPGTGTEPLRSGSGSGNGNPYPHSYAEPDWEKFGAKLAKLDLAGCTKRLQSIRRRIRTQERAGKVEGHGVLLVQVRLLERRYRALGGF